MCRSIARRAAASCRSGFLCVAALLFVPPHFFGAASLCILPLRCFVVDGVLGFYIFLQWPCNSSAVAFCGAFLCVSAVLCAAALHFVPLCSLLCRRAVFVPQCCALCCSNVIDVLELCCAMALHNVPWHCLMCWFLCRGIVLHAVMVSFWCHGVVQCAVALCYELQC